MVKKAAKATKSPRKGLKSASKPKQTGSVDYSKPLANARHEQFCQALMKTNNATQAAKDAKYSENGAQQTGSRLLLNVVIRNRIAVLQVKLSEDTGVDAKMVIEGFRKIAQGTLGKHLSNRNKLRALENLAKHLGLYSEDNKQRVGLTLADIAALAGVKHAGD